jgi:hypothetical protein
MTEDEFFRQLVAGELADAPRRANPARRPAAMAGRPQPRKPQRPRGGRRPGLLAASGVGRSGARGVSGAASWPGWWR